MSLLEDIILKANAYKCWDYEMIYGYRTQFLASPHLSVFFKPHCNQNKNKKNANFVRILSQVVLRYNIFLRKNYPTNFNPSLPH